MSKDITWTYDTRKFRSSAGRGDKELFMTGITDAGGTADRSLCLADLSAAKAAQDNGTSGVTTIATNTFSEAAQNFATTVAVGDILTITDGSDAGVYDVLTVESDTELTVNYANRSVAPVFSGSTSATWTVTRDIWPHRSGTLTKVYYLFINVDVGSSTGLIHFGWVKEHDGTNGTMYSFLTIDCSQGDQTIMLNFSDNPIIMSTDFQLTGAIADDYTVLQNDANYTASAASTNHYPEVGDFVAVYDHATAQYTRLTVYAQYTVI